jgi:hypothetical protein
MDGVGVLRSWGVVDRRSFFQSAVCCVLCAVCCVLCACDVSLIGLFDHTCFLLAPLRTRPKLGVSIYFLKLLK